MASQQVNAAKLKSTGVNLTNLAAKMKSEMNKLDENIQKVSSVWSGEASASYLKRYQADKANLAQLTQIDVYKRQVRDTADLYFKSCVKLSSS